jgi:4-amino-4-deoxy-L-arabinose transferase-like glycosyltransferase
MEDSAGRRSKIASTGSSTGGLTGHTIWLLTAILGIGFALRVAYATVDRFHADEALYAGWALLIRDGDPLLLGVPVDKPPLYLYALAGSSALFGDGELAFRLPNLAASTLSIALAYRLGKRLYDRATGTWAAALVALSPFDILFARTAFTDPMLVLWMWAALCATAGGRWLPAGVYLGLAFATKQHAVLLIPLVVAVGAIQLRATGARHAAQMIKGVLGFALPFGLVLAWDSTRWATRPGYWSQSTLSYGGLSWAPVSQWSERLGEWLGWARYLAPSPPQIALLVLGSILLLVQGWRRHPRKRETWLDTTFLAYGIGYLLVHTILRFSTWDRYLLPLIAPVGLILARITAGITRWLASTQGWRWRTVPLAAAIAVLFLVPAWKAAHNGYPIGGEHWAYQGLDQVVTYLRQNAPPDAVLYHHWLRWHYSYYLHGSTFELRWWQSGEHLRREVMRAPERVQYIVLPDWRTLEPEAEGICLHPVYEAHRQDGSVSMRVYRVEVCADEALP